ncbi:hypothetical protein BDZ91DRAFT_709458 [Kalaharituber pfeilii]|nr:hypothetical protein BDZ91DRAFT_709458 [Kalaharituber pfeilii]
MTINGTPASLDDIYKYLVQPNEHGREIQSIGMMGAVSQGDHPIEGKPFWFIHPCATASTLEEWRGGDNVGSTYEITLKNYIQIWLGIVGSCVGLHLPVEAVASQQVEKRDIPSKRNHVEQAKEGAIHLTT